MFSWSRFPTWPMVAMQSSLTCRTSPEGSLMFAWSPSFASNWARVPALRQSWPPLPGCSSTLCTSVPSGMFRIGSALPGRMSACGPDITTSPGLRPRGAMILRVSAPRALRIVLDAGHLRGDPQLLAPEVDVAEHALGPAAPVPDRDAAVGVAP